jgi:hypothetical protein
MLCLVESMDLPTSGSSQDCSWKEKKKKRYGPDLDLYFVVWSP